PTGKIAFFMSKLSGTTGSVFAIAYQAVYFIPQIQAILEFFVSDIFSEVDEEVRKDKSLQLWKKYGNFVIGGSILIVAATAAVVGWQNYRQSEATAQGDQFYEATVFLADKKFEDASAAFADLAENGNDGYRGLARLRQAEALMSAGKGAEALDVYDALAADSEVGKEFSSLARILAAYYLLDNGSTDDVRSRVEGLTEPGSVFFASAQEIVALSYLKDGNRDEARRLLSALKEDAAAPQGVKA
ncbi:tetratricopeptide repeat protein, partial [Brevundimonas denitrificans]|uniref:DUF2659 family protein n=1 Tax=Brevundimonas denitrificans TaxID=1443434 RepID=UPI0024E0930B